MKVHLGRNSNDNYYILVTDDTTFYWTKDTTAIIGNKFENSFGPGSKIIQEWIKNCTSNGIKYLGYFDTVEYHSIDAYKKDYPEFFI